MKPFSLKLLSNPCVARIMKKYRHLFGNSDGPKGKEVTDQKVPRDGAMFGFEMGASW